MVSAKDTSGKRLFKSDDFLTAQQIAGFFSRLSAKKTLQDDEEQSDDDFESAVHEAEIRMNLGIWLCTNWPRDTPSLLMRTICVIWQQSPS